MYKTKRPPMYKSTVKRVTYPKKFICDRRKWCYHFFHVKMRMILSFGERQKTVIQKCTNSFFGGENVHLQLILDIKKWTFTFFCSYFRCANVHLHFGARYPGVRMYIYISSSPHPSARMYIYNLWEWTFHPLPHSKFDWKFRVIPLNWSWQ